MFFLEFQSVVQSLVIFLQFKQARTLNSQRTAWFLLSSLSLTALTLSPYKTCCIAQPSIKTSRNPHGDFVLASTAAAAKSLQSCPALWDPIDGSPPGSPIPGILQARTLEWVAISFSNAWRWKVKVKSLSRPRLLATPWTGAHQAPPTMGFSRQEYWSGLPLPSPIS